MVKCIKVNLKKANDVKSKLIEKRLLNKNYKLFKDNNFIYFPVIKKFKDYKIYNKKLEDNIKKLSLKDLLKEKLNKKQVDNIRASFEVIGEVAILELGDELKIEKEFIGDALLRSNSNLKTVLLKKGEHKGVFRVQEYEKLSGFQNTETIHKENNVKVKLDVTKVYFSPRLGNERLRIAKKVKKGEHVLVMFSGVGIYPFVIAKHSEAKYILGVEINPDACYYAEESLKLNKFKNIELRCGDVREEHLHGEFDRVIMPLPESSFSFLQYAFSLVKKNGIIHLYIFSEEDKIKDKIKEIENLVKCKILEVVKCGQRSPKEYRYCIDFKVLE